MAEQDWRAALSAIGLSKQYKRDRPWALRGVSLDIHAGAITALIGPNGSGKSTLIKCWMGFERPTQGSTLVGHADPGREREKALASIGYVPQAPAFYRSLTVEEHIQLAAALRRGFDRSYVRSRLDDVGVPLGQVALELSGGQQAQLSLAIALGTRAPTLVLDEPLASLDPLARREFLRTLVHVVRAEGRTALLSSHVVADVEQSCDRIVILSEGQVALDVDVQEAVRTHHVAVGASGPWPPDLLVATFPSPSGDPVTLLKQADRPSALPASLEDVVMGYLAAKRTNPPGRADH